MMVKRFPGTKRTVLFILLLTGSVLLAACSRGGGSDNGQAAGNTGGSGGTTSSNLILRDFRFAVPLFSSDSAWNRSAIGVAAAADSEARILTTYRTLRGNMKDHVGEGVSAVNWPYVIVNYDVFTVTIFKAGTGTHQIDICDYGGQKSWPSPNFPGNFNEPGGPVSVPDNVGQVIASGPANREADGWTVVFDTDKNIAWDFWQATTERDGVCQSHGAGIAGDSILEAGAVEFFDLSGDGSSRGGLSSAHAVGTALLAGLILPEDVESGVIAHALAYAIPDPRNISANPSEPDSTDYVYPASTTETNFYSTNPNAMIAGQKIRLKGSIVNDDGEVIDETAYAPITRMFIKALRDYGGYLIDNAGGFTFYAEDIKTANLDLTDDEVNALIGQVAGTPLPEGKTRWQIVMEKLALDLDTQLIPIAVGPWTDGQEPSTAQVDTSNFEVIESPSKL